MVESISPGKITLVEDRKLQVSEDAAELVLARHRSAKRSLERARDVCGNGALLVSDARGLGYKTGVEYGLRFALTAFGVATNTAASSGNDSR